MLVCLKGNNSSILVLFNRRSANVYIIQRFFTVLRHRVESRIHVQSCSHHVLKIYACVCVSCDPQILCRCDSITVPQSYYSASPRLSRQLEILTHISSPVPRDSEQLANIKSLERGYGKGVGRGFVVSTTSSGTQSVARVTSLQLRICNSTKITA